MLIRLKRMARFGGYSEEFEKIAHYVDWILYLPWVAKTEDNLDLARAKECMERHHYGMEQVKNRILEYMAVLKLNKDKGQPSGGSAFGLDAASGVVRFLEERGVGFDVGVAKVPIVPTAVLFDLAVGDKPQVRPTAESGYRAAQTATNGSVAEGNAGAGAGATVGKIAGLARAMKGGLGTASIMLPDGLIVAALVAVNAVGDVLDPATGQLIAGVRTGTDARLRMRESFSGQAASNPLPGPARTPRSASSPPMPRSTRRRHARWRRWRRTDSRARSCPRTRRSTAIPSSRSRPAVCRVSRTS